jgi:hypothetical protein
LKEVLTCGPLLATAEREGVEGGPTRGWKGPSELTGPAAYCTSAERRKEGEGRCGWAERGGEVLGQKRKVGRDREVGFEDPFQTSEILIFCLKTHTSTKNHAMNMNETLIEPFYFIKNNQ